MRKESSRIAAKKWGRKIENNALRIAAIVGAIVTLGGAAIAGGNWIINALEERIIDKTDAISKEIEELNKKIDNKTAIEVIVVKEK